MLKVCRSCGIEKLLSAFSRKAKNKDGLQDQCKPCVTEYLAGYVAANKERLKAVSAAYYQAHKTKHLAQSKAYAEKNKERLATLAREHYKANREKRLVAAAARYAAKGEEIRAKQVARNAANPEKRRAIDNRMRAKREAAPGSFTAEDVKRLMALQKGKCVGCRCDIRKTYHVDHILALARGGTNDRLNLQLLCPHCNKSKLARPAVEFMQRKGFLL
jgi:5-methylcytosine-specific restriction endonuclease McrA